LTDCVKVSSRWRLFSNHWVSHGGSR